MTALNFPKILPAALLFIYLILTEIGSEDESGRAWENYLRAWEDARVMCGS